MFTWTLRRVLKLNKCLRISACLYCAWQSKCIYLPSYASESLAPTLFTSLFGVNAVMWSLYTQLHDIYGECMLIACVSYWAQGDRTQTFMTLQWYLSQELLPSIVSSAVDVRVTFTSPPLAFPSTHTFTPSLPSSVLLYSWLPLSSPSPHWTGLHPNFTRPLFQTQEK